MKFGKCETKYCTNTRAKDRVLCHKCRNKKYRKANPFRYRYHNLKNSARKRHIPFNLTFKEFVQLWKDSGKWEQLLAGEPWTVDRIDVNLGYEPGNVRIVDIYLNVQVWHDSQKWQIDFRWRKRWSDKHGRPVEDCPF